MLAYLRGTIIAKEVSGGPVDKLVLEVNDVGYELSVAHPTLLALPPAGEQAMVHCSVVIRENEWTIFAFKEADEKQLFLLMQTVTGIGPKLALALVGTLGVDTLVEAVLSENQKMISQAPGVGSKVAQRIILELKTKIEDFAQLRSNMPRTAEPAGRPSAVFEEVGEILSNIGYTATEIHMALKKAREENVAADSAEDLVSFALKFLSSAQAV